MNIPTLTNGCLAIIMTGGEVAEPVLQVLGSKKIVGNGEKERYRLLVSDGKYQISFAMIATQINEKVTSGELSAYAIIKVKKYMTSVINNSGKGERRVMVILDMETLMSGSQVGNRIGNPVALPDDPSTLLKNARSSTSSSCIEPPAKIAKPSSSNNSNTIYEQSAPSTLITFPISSLSPYQNKWVIKARVANKSPIRTWSNSRGEGKLFSMDLVDEGGEIRATAFREMVDKFYDLIEIDKVYYISKCSLKVANKAFSNLKNEYEMTFTNETTVTLCTDEMSVPKVQYNFVPIDKLVDVEVNNIVDVIGVCKEVSDIVTFQSKTTNRELKKREVTLVDNSGSSVIMTLWAAEAENFDGSNNPIVAVRGAKVGEFGGGKNLSVLVNSIMKLNPDVNQAHRLRGWFDNVGKEEETTNISARSSAGMAYQWSSFKEVKDRKMGISERGDYYQCKATVLLINTNNAFYKACPTGDCNKKVIDLDNGMYRCEKCNREYPEFKYRLIVSMNLGDWSDNQWVSTFASEAEKILGQTSQQVGEAYELDKDSLNSLCNKAHFTEYIFKCRAKLETYNDESRLKNVVLKADPINYTEYNNHLISKIKEMVG